MLLSEPSVAGRPEWVQFAPAHLVAIGLIALGCLNIAYFRRELRGRRLEVWLTGAMIGLHLVRLVDTGDVNGLLPLHTCYAAMLLAVLWCVVKRQWIGQVLVLWAAVGGLIAALMPDTGGHTFPSLVVAQTFAYHAVLLWLGVEIWLVEQVRPSWRAVLPTVLATGALVPLALVANARLGTNYLFLASAPGGVFGYLDDLTGPARVLANCATGVALLLVALLVWIGLDRGLRARSPGEGRTGGRLGAASSVGSAPEERSGSGSHGIGDGRPRSRTSARG